MPCWRRFWEIKLVDINRLESQDTRASFVLILIDCIRYRQTQTTLLAGASGIILPVRGFLPLQAEVDSSHPLPTEKKMMGYSGWYSKTLFIPFYPETPGWSGPDIKALLYFCAQNRHFPLLNANLWSYKSSSSLSWFRCWQRASRLPASAFLVRPPQLPTQSTPAKFSKAYHISHVYTHLTFAAAVASASIPSHHSLASIRPLPHWLPDQKCFSCY